VSGAFASTPVRNIRLRAPTAFGIGCDARVRSGEAGNVVDRQRHGFQMITRIGIPGAAVTISRLFTLRQVISRPSCSR